MKSRCKKVYENISMEPEQLERVWEKIQLMEEHTQERIQKCTQEHTEENVEGRNVRKRKWSTGRYGQGGHLGYVCATLAVILLVNTTVYAAVKYDFAGRLKGIYEKIAGENVEIQMDEELIEKYGMVIDKKLNVDGEVLTIEAVIYDTNFMYLPCTMEAKYGRKNLPDLKFTVGKETNSISTFTTTEEKKDGLIHGFYLLQSEEPIEKGMELTVSSNSLNNDKVGLVLDHEQSDLVKEVQVEEERIDKIYVSALSVTIKGHYAKEEGEPELDVTIVKKDRSNVANARVSAGASFRTEQNEQEFTHSYNYAEPVDFEDMDHILINIDGETVKIQL